MIRRTMLTMTGAILGLLAIAFLSPGLSFAGANLDLDIGWISRSPKLNYPDQTENPTRDGWPKAGQSVKWSAHIINWGTSDARSVSYRWKLDGRPVKSGTVDVRKEGQTIVSFQWIWEFKRHDLSFDIDPDWRFTEVEENNNSLTIQTDALSVGFYVERSVHTYFQENQKNLKGAGSNSWEDWAQRQIATQNRMFAAAVSPEAPGGVVDRWRIDEIRVVKDGALPLQGGSGPGFSSRMPNEADLTVDLIWGFPASILNGDTYRDHVSTISRNPFYIEGSLLHELGHVRYLIDVYLMYIQHDASVRLVEIQQNGSPVVGTSLMPVDNRGFIYKTFETGLMNTTYTNIDRYSAVALNQIAGYRARGEFGNTIYNPVLGSFLQNIPKRNRIRLVDAEGRPIQAAQIELFKAKQGQLVPGGPFGQQYQIIYKNQPDLIAQTNTDGEFTIYGDPFRNPGESWLLTGISILRVTQGSMVSFLYFEVTAVNRAFWRGNRKEATYELVVGASPCQKAPSQLNAHQRKDRLHLEWSGVPGAYGYVVRASVDKGPWEVIGTTFAPNLDIPLKGHVIEWSVDAHFDQCLSSTSPSLKTVIQ